MQWQQCRPLAHSRLACWLSWGRTLMAIMTWSVIGKNFKKNTHELRPPFLYARLKNGRIMLWQCPSVRPSFPDFFSTCFEISIWNLVYAFSRWHDQSARVISLPQLVHYVLISHIRRVFYQWNFLGTLSIFWWQHMYIYRMWWISTVNLMETGVIPFEM